MPVTFSGQDAALLEREYMPAHWPSVDVASTLERWIGLSEAFHRRATVRSDLAYGASPRQSLDLLLPAAGHAPVLAFIHGGYWRNRKLAKRSYTLGLIE